MLQFWNKYKYWIISMSAMVWMTLFDSNNFVELYKLRSEISDLQDKKKYYKEEIVKLRNEEKHLFSSERNLEKFAREKYLMKKDNEDIFILSDE